MKPSRTLNKKIKLNFELAKKFIAQITDEPTKEKITKKLNVLSEQELPRRAHKK